MKLLAVALAALQGTAWYALARCYSLVSQAIVSVGTMTCARVLRSLGLCILLLVTAACIPPMSSHTPKGIQRPGQVSRQAAMTWRSTSPMSVPLAQVGATALSNGLVLVVGSARYSSDPADNTLLYDPKTDTWSTASGLNANYGFHTQTLLSDGRVLVLGGGYLPVSLPRGNCPCPVPAAPAADLYDPIAGAWTFVPYEQQCGGDGHTATLLHNGLVLVVGGSCAKDDVHAPARLFNPMTQTWSDTEPMLLGRRGGHSATLLPDGRVLIVGGSGT